MATKAQLEKELSEANKTIEKAREQYRKLLLEKKTIEAEMTIIKASVANIINIVK